MPMPEATVNKNYFFTDRKNQIGLSGEVFAVKTETEAETVSQRADLKFGGCVFAADSPHILASAHPHGEPLKQQDQAEGRKYPSNGLH